MTARILLLGLLSLSWLAACVEPAREGPAGRCAEVVRIYRDLQKPVEITGEPRETSEGNVEIQYEGTDPMNLPVQGSAACTFAVGDGGALTLIDASVDGSPLAAAELDSVRTELSR